MDNLLLKNQMTSGQHHIYKIIVQQTKILNLEFHYELWLQNKLALLKSMQFCKLFAAF